MATFVRREKSRIRLSDGRRGVQYVAVYDDGTRELTEVVVYRLADGTRVRHVYSFADLGNGVTWEVEQPA
jgi:hypothetical protein